MSEVKRSRVNMHSKLTVVSSKPTGPGKTHRLTPLDHAMGLHTLHVVFYYRANPFEDGPFASDLDNLRVSLSELLTLYPPVTGRLTSRGDGNWEVKCNDAGVRMLRATVGSTIDEWLGSVDASEERDLTVWEEMPDDPSIWSPFRIQLNDFEGGGLAIGLSFTHMHADLTFAALLFKSWTDINRGGAVRHPPFFHLPALHSRPISPNTNIESTKYFATKPQTAKLTPNSAKMATATFRFSHTIIKKCLSKVNDTCRNATPFDLLAALFWSRVSRLNSPSHNHKHSLSIGIDFRKLLKSPPIPHGYFFGNALHFSLLSLDAKELEGRGLGHVAGVVHNHVAGLDEEELLSAVDWLEKHKGESGKYSPPCQMYGPELTCISMEHMMMYGAMFKEGEKPVQVSCHVGNVEGEGLILVMPSPEEGLGRTVTVTLPQEQIARLCDDQIILDLEPTMVISGRL